VEPKKDKQTTTRFCGCLDKLDDPDFFKIKRNEWNLFDY